MKNTKEKNSLNNIIIFVVTSLVIFGICFLFFLNKRNQIRNAEKTTIVVSEERFLEDFDFGKIEKVVINHETGIVYFSEKNVENRFSIENPDIPSLEDTICTSDIKIVNNDISNEQYRKMNIEALLLVMVVSLIMGLLVSVLVHLFKNEKWRKKNG